jgi:hypothetical protein
MPEVDALDRDVRALEGPGLSPRLLRAYLEEFAARARTLQGKGPPFDSAAARILSKLKAHAYERGVSDVYGLSRQHVGSWTSLAARAKARRELLLGPGTTKEEVSARMEPGASPSSEDEPGVLDRRPSVPPAAPPVQDEAPPESLVPPLPLLARACERGPVVLIGGIVKHDKVQVVQERFQIPVEWIPTRRSTNTAIASMEKRVREGRIAAVVVLHGLMAHKHFDPLVAAARQINLPFAYADKAGLGSIARAFEEIERSLARREG